MYKGTAVEGNTKHILHQFVAIKVVKIPSSTSSSSNGGGGGVDYRKKILKEVKLHKHLEHYNILRLLNYAEQEHESVWIVLEYAEGGDLFDKISTSQAKSLYTRHESHCTLKEDNATRRCKSRKRMKSGTCADLSAMTLLRLRPAAAPDVGISEELAHLYYYQLLAALVSLRAR